MLYTLFWYSSEKIIERYPEQKFYGIMLESFYNDKFDFMKIN